MVHQLKKPQLLRSRGAIMARAGPLIYVGFAVLLAYALSAGNAGTAFQYRTHILVIAICALVALRFAGARAERGEGVVQDSPEEGPRELAAGHPLPIA